MISMVFAPPGAENSGSGGGSGTGGWHLHYHSCAVCTRTVIRRQSGETGLKMCPCAEVSYCGRDHQEKHWKIHKKTCFARSHKNPSVMDEAVKYLLRVHDVAIVDIAVGALLKNDVNVDFRREFERQAVFLTIEQRENEETMADAHAAGHTPTIKITEDVCTVLIEEMATQLLGKDCQSFENPDDRKARLARGDISVTMIFLPTWRVVTKYVHKVQLAAWELKQKSERRTNNPPILYWSIGTTNGAIHSEIYREKQKRGGVEEK